MSIDENRHVFKPTLWNETPPREGADPRSAGQVLRQVWFPGVHADVGGGYPARGLSDVALHDYGKAARPGRKLGHITTVADSASERDARIRQISEIVT